MVRGRLVVVFYRFDLNRGYPFQVNAPFFMHWHRVVIWREKKTKGMFQIDGEGALEFSREFMTANGWEMRDLGKIFEGAQLHQSPHQFPSALRAVGFDRLLLNRATLLEFLCSKGNPHHASSQIS